ncbi:hypothetical protein fugu_015656 [Takifugu bimaculatus]|uniref:Uncharacterized protein n=1 Tax=Takifugu bimaculatus TaxID=433685 RepID=A0A4Z2C1E0_9TELE|nr:hypothetical protein fugu_015656 [Takifugu bimaculatus]
MNVSGATRPTAFTTTQVQTRFRSDRKYVTQACMGCVSSRVKCKIDLNGRNAAPLFRPGLCGGSCLYGYIVKNQKTSTERLKQPHHASYIGSCHFVQLSQKVSNTQTPT